VGQWRYPEFAQQEQPFLALLDALPETPWFGVQYDPSNAVIAGIDPIALLERVKHRVVTVHASDRFLAPGVTLDAIRQHDGTIGYPDQMKHGETGKGTNDYDAIFQILRSIDFDGWISVEDGMNGLDEIRRSVEFLKEMRQRYYGDRAE
jgi:sugar phosphate isomerase/epimerase